MAGIQKLQATIPVLVSSEAEGKAVIDEMMTGLL